MSANTRPRWFLKQWLKHLKITQEELAARAGMGKSHLSEIMSGRLRYNEETLGAIADALGRTPAEILSVDPSHDDESQAPIPLAEVLDLFDRMDQSQRETYIRMEEALAPKAKGDKG